MKGDFKTIIGKTIKHVVTTEGERPKNQIYLVFDDNTYLELYGLELAALNEVREGNLTDVKKILAMYDRTSIDVIPKDGDASSGAAG